MRNNIHLFVVLFFILIFIAGCASQSQQSTPPAHATSENAHGAKEDSSIWQNASTVFNREKTLSYTLDSDVKVFTIVAKSIKWELFPSVTVNAYGYNGQVPGPEIRVEEGDKVRVIVKNEMPVPTSVHWHGVHVPNSQDGVPDITQKPIQPDETYTYEFTATPAGTHAYHTHGPESAEQLDRGLYGAFIIEPKNKTTYDREYTFILDEWTKTGGHGHSFDNYVYFTINGKAFPATEPIEVKEGEKVLIRWINMGQQDHPMHLHGHSFKVIAQDGYILSSPYTIDTLTVAPGERYDVELIANNPGTWLYHCHNLHHVSNDGKEHGGLILVLKYI